MKEDGEQGNFGIKKKRVKTASARTQAPLKAETVMRRGGEFRKSERKRSGRIRRKKKKKKKNKTDGGQSAMKALQVCSP